MPSPRGSHVSQTTINQTNPISPNPGEINCGARILACRVAIRGDIESRSGARSQRAASRLLSTPGGRSTTNNQTNPISPNPHGNNAFPANGSPAPTARYGCRAAQSRSRGLLEAGQSFYGWSAAPLKGGQPVETGFPLHNGNLLSSGIIGGLHECSVQELTGQFSFPPLRRGGVARLDLFPGLTTQPESFARIDSTVAVQTNGFGS